MSAWQRGLAAGLSATHCAVRTGVVAFAVLDMRAWCCSVCLCCSLLGTARQPGTTTTTPPLPPPPPHLTLPHPSHHHRPGPEPATGLVIANDADAQRCNLLTHQTKRMCSPALLVTNHEAQNFPLIANLGPAAEQVRSACGACAGVRHVCLCN